MSRHQFLLSFVLVGVLVVLANGEKSTSHGCRILHYGKALQCRGVGLSKIPEIPKGIRIADFEDNLINHVSPEDWRHLEKLKEVYLKSNPFHCDCKLEHLRLTLVRNNPPIIQEGESIKCYTPLQIKNKALKSLSNLCAGNKCGEDCGSNAACTNLKGSYACNCKEGYQKTSFGTCEDINECKTGAHKCDKTTSTCLNTNGDHTCNCNEGYNETQHKQCVDFDECKVKPEKCGFDSTCKNIPGSYECICEETGYKHDHKSRSCLDVDECLKGSQCGKNMVCQNSQGSYSCNCKPHYRKDGNECKDIDECADKNIQLCEGDMKCFNIMGSYKCECGHGFLPDAYKKCKDLDECKVRKHNCSKQSYCRNMPGSFKCECPEGYKGNGIKCSLTRWKRFTTPKHLLNDFIKGAWDTIVVVLSTAVLAIALLLIGILMLKKMCRKCCRKCCRKKKGYAYQDQMFYPEELYDPDHMFFTEGEQLFYPDEMGYYPGEEGLYPEGADYPEVTGDLEETGNPDEVYYEDTINFKKTTKH